MRKLIFITGGFCSGTTLMWMLFRQSCRYHSLYEPLHERLLEFLIWPLRPYEHHYFVKDYFSEYKNFHRIPDLFNPEWGVSQLYIPANEPADELYNYLKYLVDSSFTRSDRVLLQFNRVTFRLEWLRNRFPDAKVIHIYRDMDSQWNSIVSRVQAHHGKKNVGQKSVMFYGMNIAGWCEDLKDRFPELSRDKSKSGYERFSKLWRLSYEYNNRFSDLTINLHDLTDSFDITCKRIFDCAGDHINISELKPYVVPSYRHEKINIKQHDLRHKVIKIIDKIGFKYARLRILTRNLLLKRQHHY